MTGQGRHAYIIMDKTGLKKIIFFSFDPVFRILLPYTTSKAETKFKKRSV